MAWYSGDEFELSSALDRALGNYRWCFWALIACNVGAVQTLWVARLRRSVAWLFAVSLTINVGMWLERYVIVVQSLHHDFLPSSWRAYQPTVWDWLTLTGSVGLFVLLFLLFVRLLPVISMTELSKLAAQHFEGEEDVRAAG
jgi:molybdopterin-containing oxidoreductase family membrane subunit